MGALKDQLEQADPLAFPILQWCIASNRCHLTKLPKEAQFQSVETPFQYLLASAAPDKEQRFQQLKRAPTISHLCGSGSGS